MKPPSVPPPPGRPFPLLPAAFLIVGVFACAVYANLSFAVVRSADYRYFPPFRRHVDANQNRHLGGEAFNIGRSLAAGRGFADPFWRPTGATGWMPPVLPGLLAGLLRACNGDRDAVMAVVVFVQVSVLIGTGLLVLALVRRTTSHVGAGVVVGAYFAALLCHFRLSFQSTRDCWLVLLALDVLLAGLCWWQPWRSWQTAVGWGLVGGFCAQTNPIVGFTWGVLSLLVGRIADPSSCGQRTWSLPAVAFLVAGLTLVPWTVRNYLVFGRLIPVKSNLSYELYQAQCLEPDGLCQKATIALHPHTASSAEARQYDALGEAGYLGRKGKQFRQAVWSGPLEFIRRLGQRFLGATLWYVPFDREPAAERTWVLWLHRLTHPLPFLALLFLLGTSRWRGLEAVQWLAISVYGAYLLTYICISYFDRYGYPLVGVKVLLLLWAGDRLVALLVRKWARQ